MEVGVFDARDTPASLALAFDLAEGADLATDIPRYRIWEHGELVDEADALAMVEVDLVEALGADTLVHGHAGDMALTLRLPGSHPVTEGDRLPVAVAPEHFHLFDPVTGRRVGN